MRISLSLSFLYIIFLIKANPFHAKDEAHQLITYPQHLNETYCPSIVQRLHEPQQSVLVLISYRINFTNIMLGQPVISSISFQYTFRIIWGLYFTMLFVIYIKHKQLVQWSLNLIKSNLSFKESNSSTLNEKAAKLIKRLIIFLLIFNVYNTFKGIYISNQIGGNLQQLICKLLNFPNQRFVVDEKNRYYSFSQYQSELTILQQKINSISSGFAQNIEIQDMFNFKAKTQKYSSLATSQQSQKHIQTIKKQTLFIDYIQNQSQIIQDYISFLREILYQIKVGLSYLQNQINSHFRIEAFPRLLQSLSKQVYMALLLCSSTILVSLLLLIIRQRPFCLLKYINFTLLFSIILSISCALCIHLFLSLPYQACLHISSKYQQIKTIQKLDKNVLQQLNQIVLIIGAKKDSNYYQQLSDQLIFALPEEMEQITLYSTFLYSLNKKNLQTLTLLRDSLLGIDKKVALQRLNLTPLYQYQQQIHQGLCIQHIGIWQKSINLCLLYGFTHFAIMMVLIFYIRDKVKSDDNRTEEEESIKLVDGLD